MSVASQSPLHYGYLHDIPAHITEHDAWKILNAMKLPAEYVKIFTMDENRRHIQVKFFTGDIAKRAIGKTLRFYSPGFPAHRKRLVASLDDACSHSSQSVEQSTTTPDPKPISGLSDLTQPATTSKPAYVVKLPRGGLPHLNAQSGQRKEADRDSNASGGGLRTPTHSIGTEDSFADTTIDEPSLSSQVEVQDEGGTEERTSGDERAYDPTQRCNSCKDEMVKLLHEIRHAEKETYQLRLQCSELMCSDWKDQAEVARYKAENLQLTHDMRALSAENATLLSEIESLHRQQGGSENDIARKDEEITRLRKENELFRSQIKMLQMSADDAKREKEVIEKQLRVKNSETIKCLAALKKEASLLEDQVAEGQQRVLALEYELEQRTKALEECTEKAKALGNWKEWKQASRKEKLRCLSEYYGDSSTSQKAAIDRFCKILSATELSGFNTERPLTRYSIPWPILVITQLSALEWDGVYRFFQVLRVSRPQTYKSLVRKAKLVFHPDNWAKHKVLETVLDMGKREELRVAALVVSQAINGLEAG